VRDQNLRQLLMASQSRVRRARSMLAHPRSCRLDECLSILCEAQGYLEWLRDSLPEAPSANLRAEALVLANDIRQTGVLLERGARLGRRWLARLAASAGYTAAGQCVPLAARGRLSIIG
jgi:hypothetical protein